MDSRAKKGAPLRVAAIAAFLLGALGCSTVEGYMVDDAGQRIASLDSLWEVVNDAFSGALPKPVTVRLIDATHSGFDIESNAVMISRSFSAQVSRGKVCMGLTHLALHRLTGGDERNKGRCFDNDVRFLEYAVATYMDRIAAGSMEQERPQSFAVAARLVQEGKLSVALLRNWEAFCYKGRWADQFEEWNLEGLQALLTLTCFFVNEKGWELKDLGRVFARLEDRDLSLDAAFFQELGADLNAALGEWQSYVVEVAGRMQSAS
jgi:hypothetical protein